jgi:hypothetical protein
VRCWGYNGNGQLGDGTRPRNRSTPVAVTGSAGPRPSRRATTTPARCSRTARCAAGATTATASSATAPPPRASRRWRSGLSDGHGHRGGLLPQSTCALVAGGAVQCWGDNGNGQVGDGSFTSRLTPVAVSGLIRGHGHRGG